MQIKKNGFVYTIAYRRLLDDPKKHRCPNGTTNLCRFFWRFMWSLIVVWPLELGIMAVLLTFAYGVNLLNGCWIDINGNSKPIKWWPKLFSWRIRPWVLLLLALYGWFWIAVPEDATDFSLVILTVVGAFAAIVAVVGVGFILISTTKDKYREYKNRPPKDGPKDGALYVVTSFIKAKKQKVCPIIEFVDSAEPTK